MHLQCTAAASRACDQHKRWSSLPSRPHVLLGAPPRSAARAPAADRRPRPTPARGFSTANRSRRRKGGPPNSTGYDGGKKVQGRSKRPHLVDTTDLVLTVLVHPANVTDRVGGQQLLEAFPELAARFPRLRQVWVESAYHRGASSTGWSTRGAGTSMSSGVPAAGSGCGPTKSRPPWWAASMSCRGAGSLSVRSAG
jgi:DDE family transposase